MMLRCLIVDDEPLAHDILLRYLEDTPFLELAGQCYRATEALDFLNKQAVDLIFLDIRMPKLSGLDLLRTLKHAPLVIITSAHEEHALESYDLEVCDYLLKPFRYDRFLKAANRALAQFRLQQPAAAIPESTPPAQIAIKSDKKILLLEPDTIQYLESMGNYVKVWEAGRFILTQRTLSSFEEQLPPDQFIRIHKSYILNRKYLHFIEGNSIHLKNGTALTIGKNYRHVLKTLTEGHQ